MHGSFNLWFSASLKCFCWFNTVFFQGMAGRIQIIGASPVWDITKNSHAALPRITCRLVLALILAACRCCYTLVEQPRSSLMPWFEPFAKLAQLLAKRFHLAWRFTSMFRPYLFWHWFALAHGSTLLVWLKDWTNTGSQNAFQRFQHTSRNHPSPYNLRSMGSWGGCTPKPSLLFGTACGIPVKPVKSLSWDLANGYVLKLDVLFSSQKDYFQVGVMLRAMLGLCLTNLGTMLVHVHVGIWGAVVGPWHFWQFKLNIPYARLAYFLRLPWTHDFLYFVLGATMLLITL